MKTYLLLPGFLLLFHFAHAQVGLNGGYHLNEAPDWVLERDDASTAGLITDAVVIGLDYWIPLRVVRIDLLPEINFSQSEINLSDPSSTTFRQRSASLLLNANFYLFDLEGDCDCPTFSKSGSPLEKGFFLRASPGLSYFDQTAERGGELRESQTIAYSLGVGAGFDIGLSDLITITPIATYRYFLPTDWEGLNQLQTELPTGYSFQASESTLRQIYVGLRLGLRFRA